MSPTPTTVRPLPRSETDTKGGSYFISNYPPFSFWATEGIEDAEAVLKQSPKPDTPLGLYVHIPFCRKRCHFCYFKVYTDKNAAAIQQYLDAVISEAHRYAESNFIKGRKLSYVYFGGGTPSYLSAKQLAYLTDGLKGALDWDETEEIAFECEPGTLNENKLGAIRQMGVTRLSFGIENFDDHILEINGRAHLSKQVYAAYDWARSVNFPQINIDLIAGMLEETDENWQRNIDKTLELDPDCVTIYQMEIPFNTGIYQSMKDAGKLVAPVADWDTKRRWVKQAFAALEEAGYTITSAYTAVKNAETTKFVYRDNLWHGADMVALGVASFGHLNQTHYQNVKSIEPYIEAIESGKLPMQRAMRISDDEALVREMILQMKLGELDASYFQNKFNVNILERFDTAFQEYIDTGFISVNGNTITIDRDGLLQVDAMLPSFFLPEHKDARYA